MLEIKRRGIQPAALSDVCSTFTVAKVPRLPVRTRPVRWMLSAGYENAGDPIDQKVFRNRRRQLSGYDVIDQSFAVTLTPRTEGIVFGAPIAAPMIIGNGTGFSGAALIVRLFGPSR